MATKLPPKQATKVFSIEKYGRHILLLVPFLLYIHTLTFDFVYHDDDVIIIEGAEVLQRFNISELFQTDAWLKVRSIELYRPWQSLTYAFDHGIGGGRPWVFHLHNILVFCLAIQLLFMFLKRLELPVEHSFWLALLFSAHFLFSHTVSWVPARGDLYLTLFCLACFINWHKYITTGNVKFMAQTVVLYLLALFAKESAITLLPLFVLIYLLFRGSTSSHKTAIYSAIPLILATIFYFNLRADSISPQRALFTIGGFIYNLPTIPEEVFKFFVPAFFSVLPAFNSAATLVGTALLVGLCGLFLWQRKAVNWKLCLLGAAVFFLPILPSLAYKPQFAGFAYDYLDHRMFFPGIGLLLVAYALATPLLSRRIPIYVLVAVLVGSAAFAVRNSLNYKDKYAYYDNATQTNPASGLAWRNYAVILFNEKQYDNALEKVSRLIEVCPDSMRFRLERASVFKAQGDFDLMLNECRDIIQEQPDYLGAYHYLAKFYAERNMPDSVISVWSTAIRVNPRKPEFYHQRSLAHRSQKRDADALADLDRCISTFPDYAPAHFERGNIRGNQGMFQAAYEDFNAYVLLKPEDGLGYFYRGQALFFIGRKNESCADMTKAVKMKVKDAVAKRAEFCR